MARSPPVEGRAIPPGQMCKKYLSYADHPAAGYVDQPPLSIWLLGAWRSRFGASLASVRVLATLFGATLVFATGCLARRLGGGRPAQTLAARAVALTPVSLGSGQAYSMNVVVTAAVVHRAVVSLLGRCGHSSRLPAAVYLTTAAILMLAGTGRPEYLAPAYPPLFAAGAIALERATRRNRVANGSAARAAGLSGRGVALRAGATAFVIITALPQYFADMHGWPELANDVARVYHALPGPEQRRCVIYGQNYGGVGAICVLGRPLGLPPAISGHNAFWTWGPGPDVQDPVVIIIGGEIADHAADFERSYH